MDMAVFDGEFNLTGRSGQTIALVGPSGCGMLLSLLIFFTTFFQNTSIIVAYITI